MEGLEATLLNGLLQFLSLFPPARPQLKTRIEILKLSVGLFLLLLFFRRAQEVSRGFNFRMIMECIICLPVFKLRVQKGGFGSIVDAGGGASGG